MKKKVCYWLTWICLLLGTVGSVCAQEENVTDVSVETEHFSIMLPADCYILGQTIDEDDTLYLEKVGADKTQIEESFQNAGIVLDAVAKDNSYEIVVTVVENQDVAYIYNMKSLSDETMISFGNTISESYESYGYTMDGMDIFETADAKYVRLLFGRASEDKQISYVQYYTIKGNQVYNFTLRYYAADIPEDVLNKMQQIMDEVHFTQTADTDVYQNAKAGVTFCVKEGWTAAAEQSKDAYIQMQYINDLGESIQFLCMDLWGNLDVLHQFIQTREEMDIQHELTAKERKQYKSYLEGFFADYSTATEVIKNQTYYLTQEEPLVVQAEQGQDSYLQKSYVTIRNGILYVFQYGYYEGKGLHEADFHEMIETVSYEEASLLEKDAIAYQQIAKVGYGIITAIFLVIVILIFIIYLYVTGYHQREEK